MRSVGETETRITGRMETENEAAFDRSASRRGDDLYGGRGRRERRRGKHSAQRNKSARRARTAGSRRRSTKSCGWDWSWLRESAWPKKRWCLRRLPKTVQSTRAKMSSSRRLFRRWTWMDPPRWWPSVKRPEAPSEFAAPRTFRRHPRFRTNFHCSRCPKAPT